ncbi:hypothetical protein EEL40_09425 [Muribaculaceae bacterium Isolate-083 (Janvier)]|nr:hypothetical protein EEL37_13385 [Muribaculaceae bacterium Isolate-077 (Janvier)]ROS96064.1 hypothetical protein EEL40_09425 [Muribaculaceae bacterium Isolate-083 (Janvier)]
MPVFVVRYSANEYVIYNDDIAAKTVQPPLFSYVTFAKLLQKSEMRKDIVIELSYRGFSRASDYS